MKSLGQIIPYDPLPPPLPPYKIGRSVEVETVAVGMPVEAEEAFVAAVALKVLPLSPTRDKTIGRLRRGCRSDYLAALNHTSAAVGH